MQGSRITNVEKAFRELKKEIWIKYPVLVYYGVDKPVTLSVDASQNGLGAVPLQENLPIAYGSKTLTSFIRVQKGNFFTE